MKRLLRVWAALTALTAGFPAYAADLAKAPPYMSAPAAANWGGLYFGGEIGGEFGAKPLTGAGVSGPVVPGSSTLVALGDPGAFGPNAVGFAGGIFVGLNYQFPGAFVIGTEIGGDLSSLNSSGSAVAPVSTVTGGIVTPTGAGVNVASVVSKPWDAYWIGKLGFTAGPRREFLFYGFGGLALAEIKNDTTGTVTTTGAPLVDLKASADNIHTGWTVGAGVDWKPIGDHFAVGLRYRYSNYGTHGVVLQDPTLAAASFRSDQHAADNSFMVRAALFLN